VPAVAGCGPRRGDARHQERTRQRGDDDSQAVQLAAGPEANEGGIGSASDDPEVHAFIGDAFRHVGTDLYGRRMYETMVFWETVHQEPEAPVHILEYGEISSSTARSGVLRTRSSNRRPCRSSAARRRGSSAPSIRTRFAGSRP